MLNRCYDCGGLKGRSGGRFYGNQGRGAFDDMDLAPCTCEYQPPEPAVPKEGDKED